MTAERLPYFSLNEGDNRVRVETPFPFERSVVHWIREDNRTRKIFCEGPDVFCRWCHMRVNPVPRWNLIVREPQTNQRFCLEIGQAIWGQINDLINDYGANFFEEYDLCIRQNRGGAITYTYSVRAVRRR